MLNHRLSPTAIHVQHGDNRNYMSRCASGSVGPTHENGRPSLRFCPPSSGAARTCHVPLRGWFATCSGNHSMEQRTADASRTVNRRADAKSQSPTRPGNCRDHFNKSYLIIAAPFCHIIPIAIKVNFKCLALRKLRLNLLGSVVIMLPNPGWRLQASAQTSDFSSPSYWDRGFQ